jgi:Secretion system C-terminal sorting domain
MNMGSKFYLRFAMVLFANVIITLIAVSQTTITVPISDPNDDCEQYLLSPGGDVAGFMDVGSSDLELSTESEGEPHIIGLIFRNMLIPKGATITNAYVQFECDEVETSIVNLTVLGAKESNVTAPFAGTPGEISSHPKTTATIAWAPPAWAIVHERGPAQRTPDIKTIVQEIIGVSGWASGNNMLIMVTDPSLTKGHQTAEAYEGESAGAAALVVTYTLSTGINQFSAEFSDLIYPNPTRGQVIISNPSTGKFGYAIYTINGSLVAQRNDISGLTTEVNISGSARGTYIVEVKSAVKTERYKLSLQ